MTKNPTMMKPKCSMLLRQGIRLFIPGVILSLMLSSLDNTMILPLKLEKICRLKSKDNLFAFVANCQTGVCSSRGVVEIKMKELFSLRYFFAAVGFASKIFLEDLFLLSERMDVKKNTGQKN